MPWMPCACPSLALDAGRLGAARFLSFVRARIARQAATRQSGFSRLNPP
ncbi:hypothetical protein HS961_09865 [Comamonas piscis]|uniref:Uncharacterized protein n=1 Tax=Comamonas piscis TaxID=1562974 RepID=A0A7G5EGJ3_9BURK|nr:hypothetical protein [Comamonas piscis]QMV73118.1 hypothetical protein HS961_09865 [Comamonas piscis]WSO35905.1 hypothetical protein VUJ63_09895 [Comamonas piscis]